MRGATRPLGCGAPSPCGPARGHTRGPGHLPRPARGTKADPWRRRPAPRDLEAPAAPRGRRRRVGSGGGARPGGGRSAAPRPPPSAEARGSGPGDPLRAAPRPAVVRTVVLRQCGSQACFPAGGPTLRCASGRGAQAAAGYAWASLGSAGSSPRTGMSLFDLFRGFFGLSGPRRLEWVGVGRGWGPLRGARPLTPGSWERLVGVTPSPAAARTEVRTRALTRGSNLGGRRAED